MPRARPSLPTPRAGPPPPSSKCGASRATSWQSSRLTWLSTVSPPCGPPSRIGPASVANARSSHSANGLAVPTSPRAPSCATASGSSSRRLQTEWQRGHLLWTLRLLRMRCCPQRPPPPRTASPECLLAPCPAAPAARRPPRRAPSAARVCRRAPSRWRRAPRPPLRSEAAVCGTRPCALGRWPSTPWSRVRWTPECGLRMSSGRYCTSPLASVSRPRKASRSMASCTASRPRTSSCRMTPSWAPAPGASCRWAGTNLPANELPSRRLKLELTTRREGRCSTRLQGWLRLLVVHIWCSGMLALQIRHLALCVWPSNLWTSVTRSIAHRAAHQAG
mmetsp:Transcript_149954/g.481874  ORF Transcript_149954/g.481874 Transcript_149954/m.481874 type:complete len:334 (-) Transcript_149954:103-1104(-)